MINPGVWSTPGNLVSFRTFGSPMRRISRYPQLWMGPTSVCGHCFSCFSTWTPITQYEPPEFRILADRVAHRKLYLRLGSIFGSFDKDPAAPFTLYGTNFKKLFIEQLDEFDKVVSRKRGVTVTTCVAIEPKSDETPEFKSLPLSQQARLAPNKDCQTVEGQDLDNACTRSCTTACASSVDRYTKTVLEQLGFGLGEGDKAKVVKSCIKRCAPDCSGAGRPFNFFVRFQR